MSKTTSTTRRITITIPDYLEERLRKQVPAGQVSSFVAEAIERRIDDVEYKLKENPVEKWFRLGEDLPKYSSEEIQKMIDEGRP